MKKNIFYLLAHQDDEFGCFVKLDKDISNENTFVLYLTSGENKAAQKNKKVDRATDLGNMIDRKSRNKNIIIHPELKPFIPALLDDEKKLLEESIRKEGVREKIVLFSVKK